MPAPRFVRPLDAAELAALQERYRTTNDADERSRCQMLLFSARGKTVPEIADLTLFDDDTVLYWLNRYEAEGLAGLGTKPRSGRPPKSRYAL
jgi:transposase